MSQDTHLMSWRAIEALRSGVPNRDAVNALGSSQSEIEDAFRVLLDRLRSDGGANGEPLGFLIEGGFGQGKSHLLEFLQQIALQENFVCSKVAVSKETSLFDSAKLYRASVEAARVPHRVGSAVSEIATKISPDSAEYADFFRWVNSPECGLSVIFAATVFIHERSRDPEVTNRIQQFWAGDKLNKPEVRSWLKALGELSTYRVDKANATELASQRYIFFPRLARAAGFAGWVLLIDEAELVGRYAFRQRARSYAQVARLLGKAEGAHAVGTGTVFAIADEFCGAILNPMGKHDEERIPNRLRAKGSEADTLLASQAERGMRLIQKHRFLLQRPNAQGIAEIHGRVRSIYQDAYGWGPPLTDFFVDETAKVRTHLKRWINEWDLGACRNNHTDGEATQRRAGLVRHSTKAGGAHSVHLRPMAELLPSYQC